jgi:hypothetical protein
MSCHQDGLGDACDDDDDADGVDDVADNCRIDFNPDQTDVNHDGFGNLCDADFDDDRIVGIIDFGQFKPKFGLLVPNPDPGLVAEFDLDSDGAIGITDFGRFRSLFGRAPGPSGLSCQGTPPCPQIIARRASLACGKFVVFSRPASLQRQPAGACYAAGSR